MKKTISLFLALSTLLLSLTVPTLSASAADKIVIDGEPFKINGVTYQNGTSIYSNYYSRTTFTFEDDDYGPINDNNNTENRALDLFNTITGKEDTEGHGKVVKIYGEGGLKKQTIRPLPYKKVAGGVFVFDYEMYVKGDFNSSTAQLFSMATRDASDNRTWSGIGSQLNFEKKTTEGSNYDWILRFTHPDGSKTDMYTLKQETWFRFTIMMDLRKETFTFLIDGVPVLTDGEMKVKNVASIDTLEGTAQFMKDGSYYLLDNVKAYQYFTDYSAEAKGVASDDSLIDTVKCTSGSKIAVKFSTPMMTSALAENVSLISEKGNAVVLKEFSDEDYDSTTSTLYLTVNEDLKPNSEYTVELKPNILADDGSVATYGVATVDGVGYTEKTELKISTEKTAYGIENIDCASLAAGTTVDADITLRTDDAEDASLVLVLYDGDGKMRSISSKKIESSSVSSSYTLPVSVPESGSGFKLCAMLLGNDYQVIDVLSK